jgi:hypothetical protein
MRRLILPILLSYAGPVAAQAPAAASVEASARVLVQRFLDQYARRRSSETGDPAWARALRPGGAPLTPELASALAADLKAARASSGEVAGLDFDPFLNS